MASWREVMAGRGPSEWDQGQSEVDESDGGREPVPDRSQPMGKANRLAVTALICSLIGPIFVGGILAMVFGEVALDEIDESEGKERGRGMAVWAIVLGVLNLLLSILFVIGLILLLQD